MWAAEVEIWAADNPVTIELGPDRVEIDVPPMWRWPREALLALLCDDHETWAAFALDRHEYDRWAAVDPTLDDCDRFFDDWERATGQNLDTIGRLWHVLDRWPDQLESDLVTHCRGQDLRDLWAPGHGPSRLTWRRLAVLFDGLPGESLAKTAWANDMGEAKLADLAKRPSDGFRPMTSVDLTIADLIDDVRHLIYLTRLVNTPKEKQNSVPKPALYPRPGVKRTGRSHFRRASGEAQELITYMREHRGALPSGQWRDDPGLSRTG